MKLRILTLTWNGLDKLEKLRPGLLQNLNETNLPWHHYIRDNGSKDDTVKVIRDWQSSTVLEAGHNRDNFAKGMNSLIDVVQQEKDFSEDDIFLLLNNDVEFIEPASLRNMLELLNKEVAVVGARLLYSGTSRLQHAGVIFSQKYNLNPYHYRHQEESDPTAELNRYFQAVTAAVCFVRARELLQAEKLREHYSWAFEDISLCLQIGQLGKKIAYCGKTKIYHEESASLKKNPVNKLFVSQNVAQFKKDWFGKYDIDHEYYLKDKDYNLIK